MLHGISYQLGVLIAAFINVNSSKDAKRVSAGEFVPKWGESTPADAPVSESASDDDDAVVHARAAHDALRAGMNTEGRRYDRPRLRNPRVAIPDANLFAALTEG